MTLQPCPTDALLLVDVQNDFLEGGNLAVPDANAILPVINSYLELFTGRSLQVIASRDWHPETHCSFAAHGGQWPSHCVADSHGAAFSASLSLPESLHIVSKATTPERDAYSAFEGTGLTAYLKARSIDRLFICGLATDYCVLHTVMGALSEGFAVVLLEDAVKAVNVQKGDGDKAMEAMRKKGAVVSNYKEICP